MKIDVYAHVLPQKYLSLYSQKNEAILKTTDARNQGVTDIDFRVRLMNRYPDVMQVISISQPAVESLLSNRDAVELARTANDELAGLLMKYPDKFIGAVACLPLNDMEAALAEADRAITELGFKGVQIYSTVNGETLDQPQFRPLFEKMARYDLPLWLHPCTNQKAAPAGALGAIFSWPFETASAMLRLVASGVFIDYPDIKFITHHCGSMVSFFEQRIRWIMPELLGGPGQRVRNPEEHFRKFYADTAVYGSTPALMCAQAFFGAEHLLFGTDAPLGPKFGLTGATMESIQRMNIPEAEKEMILGKNAIRLLKLAL